MSSLDIGTKNSTCNSKGPQISINANNNNEEWDLGGDVFKRFHEMSPMDDTVQAGMSSIQPGLDGHLPLLHGRQHDTQSSLLLDLSSSSVFTDRSQLECPDNDGNNAGPLFERRKRSRSNSSRHRFNDVVTELGPEEVRWFYKEDKKTWKPFVGHDSLKIELMFRKYWGVNPGVAVTRGESRNNGVEGKALNGGGPVRPGGVQEEGRGSLDGSDVYPEHRDSDSTEVYVESVCVRGGLYEVNIRERECYPIYWKRKYPEVQVCTFISHMPVHH